MPKNPATDEPEPEEVASVAAVVDEMFFAEFGRSPRGDELRLMRLGIEISIEWRKREMARDFKPGDIVENLLNPSLDYREVVAVGDDWLTINLFGSESGHLPKANYRVVNPEKE